MAQFMPKRQSGHICYLKETVIETDIEDFANVTPVMISVICKIKRNNKYNLVIILFVCFLLLIITDNSIIESTV